MSESTRKVLITPYPGDTRWWKADGRRLLEHTHRIPSVKSTPGGIEYHDDFAGEVRAALITAGYRITDGQARDNATPTPARGHTTHNHLHYVSDQDNLTILPADTPGGHRQNESDTCPRCNPNHATAAAEHRRSIINHVTRDLHRAGTMPTD
jgi:hypothetical protein